MHRPPPDMEAGRNSSSAGRKVMVIADPTPHSAAALQYALSHAVVEHDEVILVHVVNSLAAWKNPFVGLLRKSNLSVSVPVPSPSYVNPNDWLAGINLSDDDFLEQMKRACEIAQPKIKVRTERIEMGNKDKATAILQKSTSLGADVIIIGQKRSISSAILGKAGGSIKGQKIIDTADYLIENSQCTCVAVQKKGQNAGYLLNTKTHKNFWLLA